MLNDMVKPEEGLALTLLPEDQLEEASSPSPPGGDQEGPDLIQSSPSP